MAEKKVKKSTQSLKKSGTRKSEKAELTITLQESFLVAFGEVGSIRKACTASSVGRSTVEDWMRNDVNSFKAKMDAARQIFREMLQDMALERAQAQKPNDNPVLLITLLNAAWPEKYRRQNYMADDSAKEMMSEWKKWVKENNKKPKADAKAADDEGDARQNAVNAVERILNRKKDTQ